MQIETQKHIKFGCANKSLLSSCKHRMKGSPVKSGEQLHIGLWLVT